MTGAIGPHRDRHAVFLPPAPGAVRLGGRSRSTAVVGAGIAGLAAATALAERGVDVTLHERESYLGGRVGGWPITLYDGSTATMSRGFHAFFRQYYNLRSLLRRTDHRLDRLTALPDYPCGTPTDSTTASAASRAPRRSAHWASWPSAPPSARVTWPG